MSGSFQAFLFISPSFLVQMAIELCQMLWTAHWMNRYLAEGLTEEETMKMVFKRVKGSGSTLSSAASSVDTSAQFSEVLGAAESSGAGVPSERSQTQALGELLPYETPVPGGQHSLPPESDMASKLLAAAQLAATPHPQGSPAHFGTSTDGTGIGIGEGTAGQGQGAGGTSAGMDSSEDLPGWLWSYERARSTLLCAEEAYVEAEAGQGGTHSQWGEAALGLATDAASFSEWATRLLDAGATWEQLRDAALVPAALRTQTGMEPEPDLYASPTASPLPTPSATGTPTATPRAKGRKQRKGSGLAAIPRTSSSVGLAAGESAPFGPSAGMVDDEVRTPAGVDEDDDAGGELPPGPAAPHMSSAVQATGTGQAAAAYRPVHAKHPTARWVRTCAANYAYTAELAVALCAEYKIRFKKEIEATAHALWLLENVPPFPDRWSALAVPAPPPPGTPSADQPVAHDGTSGMSVEVDEEAQPKPARKRSKRNAEGDASILESAASPRGRKRKTAMPKHKTAASTGGTGSTLQTDFFPRFAPDAEAEQAGCFKLLTYSGAGKGRRTSVDSALKVGEETFYACRSLPPGCTPVPLAMFPPFWGPDAVQTYRDFYNGAKIAFADYTVRPAPAWLRTQRSGEASFLASLHAVPTTISQALSRIDRVALAAARNAQRIRAASGAADAVEPATARAVPAPASASSASSASASASDTGYGSDTEGATAGQDTAEGAGGHKRSSVGADSELAKGWVGGGVGTLALKSKRRAKKVPEAVAPLRDYRIKFLANRSAAHGIPATTIVDSRGNMRMALQLRALQRAAEDVSQRATAAAAQAAALSAQDAGVTTTVNSSVTADFSGPGVAGTSGIAGGGLDEVDLSFTVHVHSSAPSSSSAGHGAGHAGTSGLASAALAATSTLRAAAAAIEHDTALGGDGHVTFAALPASVMGVDGASPAPLQVHDRDAGSGSKKKRGKRGQAPQEWSGLEGGSTTEKLSSALQAFPLSTVQPITSSGGSAAAQPAPIISQADGGGTAIPVPKPRVWLSMGISETAERRRLLAMRDEEMASWVASVQNAAKQAAGLSSAEGEGVLGEQENIAGAARASGDKGATVKQKVPRSVVSAGAR